jgi:hypothetical protein
MVHYHVLIDRYLPKGLLARLWESTGAGYIVDIGLIRSGASYVLKYLAKFPGYTKEINTAMTGRRRYSSSLGLLQRTCGSPAWTGARFQSVAPWTAENVRVLAVLDGVFYFDRGGFT